MNNKDMGQNRVYTLKLLVIVILFFDSMFCMFCYQPVTSMQNLKGQQPRSKTCLSYTNVEYESQPQSDTLQWLGWLWNHLKDENGDRLAVK